MSNRNGILQDVLAEVYGAEKHGAFSTAYDAYGVILEEVEEFWDIVKMKKKD